MAFDSAAGYNSLPQGNFTAEIFSKKAQIAFRRASVVQHITNTDYAGEIAAFGDSVRIIKEPDITITPYVRGQQVQTQDLADDDFSLVVDQSNKFAFAIDDIEERQAHHNWEAMATDRAGYKLSNEFDRNVLQYAVDQAGIDNNSTAENQLDFSRMVIGATPTTKATPTPIAIVTDGSENSTTSFSALGLLNRAQRLLDENDVPFENRWFVGDPVFYEKLGQEDSKVLSGDYVEKGDLRSGMLYGKPLRGFDLYSSNNLPLGGVGPSGTTDANFGWLLAGHMSAVTTAEQLVRVESFRSQLTFADVVRGMHVFGRQLLRPESLVAIAYNSGAV